MLQKPDRDLSPYFRETRQQACLIQLEILSGLQGNVKCLSVGLLGFRHELCLRRRVQRLVALDIAYAQAKKGKQVRPAFVIKNRKEVFCMTDAETQEITYINPAYATITGHTVESLQQSPSSCRELIHPEDRIRVLSRLQDFVDFGVLDEEFRFTRSDGEVRWAWAKGVPVPVGGGTRWLVGTVQDITSRKQAEMKISEQLDAVEAARAEAEALRRATLALSQNLAMDSVLDTLLQCISQLIPFDKATVLFVEDGAELVVAREAPLGAPKRIGLTLRASQNIFLQRILFEKKAMLLLDVCKQSEWREIQPLDGVHSWLGVPLVAGGHVLGILSLGAKAPSVFTPEHMRLAKSLAVSAAVAIQNARIHERAAIYAAELELRLGLTAPRLNPRNL